MVRHMYYAQIKKGEFRQFAVAFRTWDQMRRDRGYAPTTLFTPFVGRVNSVVMMADYESVSAFQSESERLGNDPEIMAARRAMTESVDPALGAHDELWQAETA